MNNQVDMRTRTWDLTCANHFGCCLGKPGDWSTANGARISDFINISVFIMLGHPCKPPNHSDSDQYVTGLWYVFLSSHGISLSCWTVQHFSL